MCDIDERWNGPPPRCEGITTIIIIINHIIVYESKILIYTVIKEIKVLKAIAVTKSSKRSSENIFGLFVSFITF
jgi:hypothetical protein